MVKELRTFMQKISPAQLITANPTSLIALALMSAVVITMMLVLPVSLLVLMGKLVLWGDQPQWRDV